MKTLTLPMELYFAGVLLVGATTISLLPESHARFVSDSPEQPTLVELEKSPTLLRADRPDTPGLAPRVSIENASLGSRKALKSDPNVVGAGHAEPLQLSKQIAETSPSTNSKPALLPMTSAKGIKTRAEQSTKVDCPNNDCVRRRFLRRAK